MASLRGVSGRGLSQVRKFNGELTSNKMGRELYNRVRNGDAISKIQSQLKSGGINVSKLTLERSIFDRYGIRTVDNYYRNRADRFGAGLGFNGTVLERLSGERAIKVRVKGTLKNDEVYIFDTYVNVGDTESLKEVLEKLKEIYEEDSAENKSTLFNLGFV